MNDTNESKLIEEELKQLKTLGEIHERFGSHEHENFPPMVQLSVTNVCNMACQHCLHPTYKQEPKYVPRMMDMGLYVRICEEIAKHKGTTLRLFGWGEPLLHPNLTDMILYAKRRGIENTNLITNGLNLTENKSRRLIESGLDVLEVSLDAATRETYKKVRGSAENFDTIVKNIQEYVEIRNELAGKTYVCVSIIDQPKAHQEVEEFKKYWKEHVDEVIVRKFHDFMGAAESKDQIKMPDKRHPCRCLWSRFNINADGLANLCFNDWHNQAVLGDLNDRNTSIESIWKSNQYYELRKSHVVGKPKSICETCMDWIGASWETPYETLMEKAKARQREG